MQLLMTVMLVFGGTTSSRAGSPCVVGGTVMSTQLSLKFKPETGAAYQSTRKLLFQIGCTSWRSSAPSKKYRFPGMFFSPLALSFSDHASSIDVTFWPYFLAILGSP